MTTVAVLVLCFIVGVFAMQSVLAFGFLGGLSIQWRSSAEYSPKVAIVLCLRGADPFLDRCIRALAQLNYPNFEVRIVVDDKQDPSWEILQRELTEQGAFRLAVDQLRSPNITCSLKCSSVAQAIRELDDSIEVVALLDADTIVHPNWLRELITPLADPTVGATTGNRWYMPERLSLGSLVRYSWNAAAVVIMYWCRIAWGGTLAIRRSVIDRADLLTRWQNAFCEDTMLFDTLRAHGLRQVFVPSLMMVNRENCTLRGVSAWITRQLLNSRLYHPGWLLTVMHCFATVLAPLLAFISLIAAMALRCVFQAAGTSRT